MKYLLFSKCHLSQISLFLVYSPPKSDQLSAGKNGSELIFVNTKFPRDRKAGSKFRANVTFAPRDCFIFCPWDYFIFLPQGLPHFLPTGLLHFCTLDYFIVCPRDCIIFYPQDYFIFLPQELLHFGISMIPLRMSTTNWTFC